MTRFYSSTAQPTTLSAAATNVAVSIQVTATTGFPATEFILALDYGAASQELVKVTNVAGTTLTVVRGFDSTTAQAHSLGAAVRHVHAADALQDALAVERQSGQRDGPRARGDDHVCARGCEHRRRADRDECEHEHGDDGQQSRSRYCQTDCENVDD